MQEQLGNVNTHSHAAKDTVVPFRGARATDVLQIIKRDTPIDSLTYVRLLQRCTQVKDIMVGKQVHNQIIFCGLESNIYIANTLIKMYSHCGTVEEARQVFDKLYKKTIVSYNAMIGGYAQNSKKREAFSLYVQMQEEGMQPNTITYVNILAACDTPAAFEWGKEIHAHIIKTGVPLSDVRLGNTLVNMYAKCGSLENAWKVFDSMVNRDPVTWTIMVGRFAEAGHVNRAFEVFLHMKAKGLQPNKSAYLSILRACCSPGALERGKEVHDFIKGTTLASDVSVGNALIHMYAKCGSIKDGQEVFDGMIVRDVITWNAMIGGYGENGDSEKAFAVFYQMQKEGPEPNRITFLNLLNACGALEQVKEVHAQVIESGLSSETRVGNALVHMYAKCGSINDSREVFDKMVVRDVISWNAIIGALAQHGCGGDALQYFAKMEMAGVRPNEVTFVGVLSACSHAGLVDEGRDYFSCMSKDYGIVPTMEHFGCMVGLLGRAGQLDEAECIIQDMPFNANASVWGALLGACRAHGNVMVAERAADQCLKIDPMDATTYVLLSHIYASAGMWDNVAKLGKLMMERGVKKEAERSWIEVENEVHSFVAEDSSHPEIEVIYSELKKLTKEMRSAGYSSDLQLVMHDVDDHQKDYGTTHHSEKLAIAYGLIKTCPQTPLHIYKNVRMGSDSHTVTKLISRIVGREIIVRDAGCFHHFKDGACSCCDDW